MTESLLIGAAALSINCAFAYLAYHMLGASEAMPSEPAEPPETATEPSL